MTPRYDDQFSGHIETNDPRTPLSAAGGCTWPTIPPYRLWLVSDDATGDLAFFNFAPLLLEWDAPQPAHDLAEWQLIGDDDYAESAIAEKLFTQGQNTYRWRFEIEVIAIPEEPLVFGIIRDIGRCNVTIPLPNVWAFDIDRGRTGDTFRMEQVVWDEDSPPS